MEGERPDDDPSARYRDVFGVSEFLALFTAQLISVLGDVVAVVALAVLIYQTTSSPALSALSFSLGFLPYLLGGVVVPGLLKRFRTRRLSVGGNLLSAAFALAMTLPAVPIAGLLVLITLIGVLAPIIQGVRSALVPAILGSGPAYILGRSTIRAAAMLSQVIGNGLGGLLLAVLTPRQTLLVDAASFVVAAALMQFGTRDRPPGELQPPGESVPPPTLEAESAAGEAAGQRSLLGESLADIARLLKRPVLRRNMVFGWLLSSTLIAPESLAVPYLAAAHRPTTQAGYLLAILTASSVAIDLAVARLVSARSQRRIVASSAVLASLVLVGFAPPPSFGTVCVLMALAGLSSATIPGTDQYFTNATPTPDLGAALSLNGSGLMFIQGLGFAFWGVVAEWLAPNLTIALAGVLALFVVAAFRPQERDFVEH